LLSRSAGACYGAKPITVLLEKYGYASKVKGAVFNHPSFLEPAEADSWPNVPLHINEAEQEPIFKDELRLHWEKTLAAKNLITFKRYPGTSHGFSARPENDEQQKAQQEALAQSIAFFKKHA
jgi:dienelactone hydrolase